MHQRIVSAAVATLADVALLQREQRRDRARLIVSMLFWSSLGPFGRERRGTVIREREGL